MLVYEKKTENERHLYGNVNPSPIPTTDDVQLTYLDNDGASITPSLNDIYRDASSNGVKRIYRDSDGEYINVFIGDTQIIGDELSPVSGGYKHTMRMYADGDSGDIEFNVIIENEDETEFTNVTLEAWLAEGGYTTADDKYYENVQTVAGTPKVTGIASKGDGAIVAELEGGFGTTTTFFGDTVTPAN